MPKKYVDDVFSIPAYERPEVVDTMQKLWETSGYGSRPQESAFVVHGRRRDGTPIVVPVKEQHIQQREEIPVTVGDTDVFHTQPNMGPSKPSNYDMDIADRHAGMGMYTVSKDGVYRYAKGMKSPELVQRGTDFSKYDTEMPADRPPDATTLPMVRPQALAPQEPLPPPVTSLGYVGTPEDAYRLKALPK